MLDFAERSGCIPMGEMIDVIPGPPFTTTLTNFTKYLVSLHKSMRVGVLDDTRGWDVRIRDTSINAQ